MKKSYYIGDLKFNTKKECEEYTRNIINNLGCCIINKEHSLFSFFIDLIENHPKHDEKIGLGVDYFHIIKNPISPKYYQTMIKRVDGSNVDFSWVYCCQFKERTVKFELNQAMRTAIHNDIVKFRTQQTKIMCNLCKLTEESWDNYHIDHDNPSFQKLQNNFFSITKNPIPKTFNQDNKYYSTIFKEEDSKFKNEWVLYHNQNCNLQILCKKCNLEKPKN
jgi:hypothetical protein